MSIWGVNQALPNPSILTAGADLSCPAATETNYLILTIPAGPAGMNISVLADTMFTLVMGATAPSALVIGMRISGGADVDSYTVPPVGLVNSGTLQLSPTLAAVFARGSYPAGSQLQLTINPTGQAVTAKANSRATVSFSIGADA